MKIKIGRHTYEITEKDEFMDNGAIVQLLTQSKERSDWGRKPNPVLSKKLIKELGSIERVELPTDENGYWSDVSIFRFNLSEQRESE